MPASSPAGRGRAKPLLHASFPSGVAPDTVADVDREQQHALTCMPASSPAAAAMHFEFEGAIDGMSTYRREMASSGGRGEGKTTNFATERQRREQLNEKYKALRLLIPSHTKNDRASIVGDAIEYIKELRRTMEEPRLLLEKKRHGQERRKMLKMEDDLAVAAAPPDMESSSLQPPSSAVAVDIDHPTLGGGALRSTWLQWRSKESLVDVRIVDDDVNVKLTTRKKPDCLLAAAKALKELRLDVAHVAGGTIDGMKRSCRSAFRRELA